MSNAGLDSLDHPNRMNLSFFQTMSLTTILILITVPGPAWSQEKESAETALQEAAEQMNNEKAEATSNLRDSVHENLESIQQDAQTSKELQTAAETLQSAAEKQREADTATEQVSIPASDSTAQTKQSSVEEPIEKKSILDYLQKVPVFLQSVPERVPFMRERGLIFFGRSELDYAHYSSGITSSDSGFRIRSLRAGLAKAYKYNFSMKAEVDLTDGDSNFADLYVRYRHKKWGLVTLGNQRVAQTMVNQTSRVSHTFMEEPLPAEAFGLGRRLALGWDLYKKKAGIHVNVFGKDLNGSIGDYGYAGRIYLNPTRSRFSLFHVGASLVSETMSRKTRFFSHPESRVTSAKLVDTGKYDDVYHQYIGAIEIAGARDSFKFSGELFLARWNRRDAKDPNFGGFYAQASWVLTGESFNYAQGKFIRIRPQNPKGAWEVAVRYSQVDLNDLDVAGGEERNLTAGLNWYSPGNQFRFMSNLIFVRTDENAGNENLTIFQLRAQFHW
jgi:phosphate-selective porin OprO/OprP